MYMVRSHACSWEKFILIFFEDRSQRKWRSFCQISDFDVQMTAIPIEHWFGAAGFLVIQSFFPSNMDTFAQARPHLYLWLIWICICDLTVYVWAHMSFPRLKRSFPPFLSFCGCHGHRHWVFGYCSNVAKSFFFPSSHYYRLRITILAGTVECLSFLCHSLMPTCSQVKY